MDLRKKIIEDTSKKNKEIIQSVIDSSQKGVPIFPSREDAKDYINRILCKEGAGHSGCYLGRDSRKVGGFRDYNEKY